MQLVEGSAEDTRGRTGGHKLVKMSSQWDGKRFTKVDEAVQVNAGHIVFVKIRIFLRSINRLKRDDHKRKKVYRYRWQKFSLGI